MNTPELLSPAGSLIAMRYAFAYGADAVYAGQPRYSLRVRNNDFTLANMEIGINEARRLGKKFYVTANIMPHNSKIATFLKDIEPIVALKPDAFIMADPGLIMLMREKWPEANIHLSVQANTVNYAAVKFWHAVGISRVILSRELSLEEIEEIRQRCPEMELEVFVHGALCIAYSGRCLLSGYFNHRDPNQGTCTNSCRWEYKVHGATEDVSGDLQKIEFNPFAALQENFYDQPRQEKRHPLADQAYFIEEQQRAGEYMPIIEDEHGTYILNSKDLRAIEHVDRLTRIGVHSLKIEGRTKSHYYVARTAQLYRKAIDDAVAGKPFDANLLGMLEGLANRGYTDGFYQRHHTVEYQNYLRGVSESNRQQFVGEIVDFDSSRQLAEILVKNKFAVGDTLEVILPQGNKTITVEAMQNLKGVTMQEAPGGGHRVRIPLAVTSASHGLLAKNF